MPVNLVWTENPNVSPSRSIAGLSEGREPFSESSSFRVIQCDQEVRTDLGRIASMQVRRSRFAATAESLRRGAVVVVEHATQSLAAPDRSALTSMPFVRNDQSVPETLVISFAMIMLNEILNPFA